MRQRTDLPHLILGHHAHDGSLLGGRGAADDNAAALRAHGRQLLLRLSTQDVRQRAPVNHQLPHVQRIQYLRGSVCAYPQQLLSQRHTIKFGVRYLL